MTVRPAISTPPPLPRKREHADKRPRLSLAGAVPAHALNDDVNCSGLSPAKAIQKDEAPLARRKPIQANEGQSDSRLATLARIDAIRLELHQLIESVARTVDIDLLDVLCKEKGCFSRHKAAEEARTWAEHGRLSIETGFMQLERALRQMK
jgi:hypothetical protein